MIRWRSAPVGSGRTAQCVPIHSLRAGRWAGGLILSLSPLPEHRHDPGRHHCLANPRRAALRDEIALLDSGTRRLSPPAIRCSPPTWRPAGSRSKLKRGCRARTCRSSSMTTAKASLPRRRDRLAALGYTNVRALEGGLKAWRRCRLRTVPGRQLLRKSLWRAGRVAPPHAVAAGGRSRRADRRKANIAILDVRRFDEYATMNIPGSVSVPGAELVLRAATRRARSRDHHHRQLRRPHPLDHRHAVADQCRRRQQGGGAAQRHDRLDAGQTDARARRRQARRGRRLRRRRKPTPATSPIAPASGVSARKKRGARRRRRTARSIASTSATPRNMPPATSPAFATMPGGQLVQEIDMAAPGARRAHRAVRRSRASAPT